MFNVEIFLGLSDFLADVIKIAIPTGVDRKEAAPEFRQFSNKPYAVDDCQALGSKVQKVMRSLYPQNTEECEPLSRFKAMKLFHKLMDNLKSTKRQKGDTILSWKLRSSYIHCQMFIIFQEESLQI